MARLETFLNEYKCASSQQHMQEAEAQRNPDMEQYTAEVAEKAEDKRWPAGAVAWCGDRM